MLFLDLIFEIFFTLKQNRGYYVEMINQMDFQISKPYFQQALDLNFSCQEGCVPGSTTLSEETNNRLIKSLNFLYIFGCNYSNAHIDFWMEDKASNLGKIIRLIF